MPNTEKQIDLTTELLEEAMTMVAEHDDIRHAIGDLDRLNVEVEHYRRALKDKTADFIHQEHLIAKLVLHHRKGGRYAS